MFGRLQPNFFPPDESPLRVNLWQAAARHKHLTQRLLIYGLPILGIIAGAYVLQDRQLYSLPPHH